MNQGVSICIPTYNQAQFLGQAIESALQQNRVLCEVWVADDASTDGTPGVMQRFAAEPRVHYHRHKHNLGMSGNASWVLSQAQTGFVVRLDSDDFLVPDYARTLADELIRYPEAGYAHAAVHEVDQRGDIQKDRLLARKPGYMAAEDSLRAAVFGYRVTANICMFRKSALSAVGYYRAEDNYACDWDLAVRFADAGWGNVYSDRLLAYYRVWTDAGNVRARRKGAEIDGCRRVFVESLEPAFRRRGWSSGILGRRRRALAAHQALALTNPLFTLEERAELAAALRALGDGPALRLCLILVRTGFGGTLRLLDSAELRLRNALKRLLRSHSSIR
jgi:glycosyltransferase involved in cell wall biosynthesis